LQTSEKVISFRPSWSRYQEKLSRFRRQYKTLSQTLSCFLVLAESVDSKSHKLFELLVFSLDFSLQKTEFSH